MNVPIYLLFLSWVIMTCFVFLQVPKSAYFRIVLLFRVIFKIIMVFELCETII